MLGWSPQRKSVSLPQAPTSSTARLGPSLVFHYPNTPSSLHCTKLCSGHMDPGMIPCWPCLEQIGGLVRRDLHINCINSQLPNVTDVIHADCESFPTERA